MRNLLHILKIKTASVRLFFSILIVLFLSVDVKAQILPPDFQCLRNDTLFWELPMNTCIGAFNSYDIFFSTAINGPYSLLHAVTDITATNYFHSNPSGTTFYYYMVTNRMCPGETALSSDTLNNNPPTVSPITAVSVNNGIVEVNWVSSTSPEVTNYIVYRTSPVGSLPIDTIDASVNTYSDLTSTPGTQSESYFILALDPCGNTSIFDLPHFTVFLESSVDICEQSITLDWNTYRNWLNGVERQEVWVSINNAPFTLQETLTTASSTYIFTDTNDGDEYCFYIKSIEAITGNTSFSNTHCLTLDIVEPVRSLFLQNVSVTNANEVELTWAWNDDAEIAAVEFAERAIGTSFSTIDAYTPNGLLTNVVTRQLNGTDPTQGSRFYQLQTIDDCGNTQTSNEVATIYLNGTAQNNQTNLLNWTPLERPDGVVETYDFYRIVDGISTYVETVSGTSTSFEDPVDISNPAEATICYYVIAQVTITQPDGSTISVASQSNTFCLEQLSDILAPNAFAPEGINKEFRPLIVFGETVDYQMQIFDRWGKRIFVSTNQLEGWKGRDGFFYYPSGVYVYIIRITQTNGRIVEKQGNVVLIR